MLDLELRRYELNCLDRHQIRECRNEWDLLAETKEEALSAGETYYFTGKPCKHGHVVPHGTKFGCVDCRDHISFNRAKYFDPIQRINHLLNSYKTRHRKRFEGESNLTCEYLMRIMPPDWRCPLLGYKCYFHVGKGTAQHNSWSLDRLDNARGYVVGNVMWVSKRANGLKRDLTPEQMVRVGKLGQTLINQRRARQGRCVRTPDMF